MEILILAGSPRRGGNSDTLANAFAEKAWEKGHEAGVCRVCDYKIAPCRACDRCWSRDGLPCVQDDGMQGLYRRLNTADMVVFASPLYFYGMPAQLKTVIDRFYPLCKDDKKSAFGGKKTALILCGADEDEDSFEGAVRQYEIMADYLEWEDCGVVSAAGLGAKGDAAKSDWLNAVRELADTL